MESSSKRIYPILEFDPTPRAIIEPQGIGFQKAILPERAVLCFFFDVLSALEKEGKLHQIGGGNSEMGSHPVYEYKVGEDSLTVFHPGVGAPLAAGFFDELIASGITKAIACGGCGSLKHEIQAGAALILTSAVRDEGTSYHYLAPDEEARAHSSVIESLEKTCREAEVPYRLVKSWTTDAIYRETDARRNLRLAQGCEVVEMEASAFCAVAQFRQIVFGQILYSGDLVVPEGWDHRNWNNRLNVRYLLFELAVKAALRL